MKATRMISLALILSACILPIFVLGTLGQDQDWNLEMNYDIGKYKYITRGEDLILTCKNRLNTKYVDWEYPHGHLDRIDVQYGVNNTVTVTVKNASDDVTGTYRCSFDYTKPDGDVVKVENSIQVVVLPLITTKEANITVDIGQKLTLECNIKGGVPAPSFQQWDIEHEDPNFERNKLPENSDEDGPITDIHTVTKSTERWKLESNSNGQAKGRLVIKEVQVEDSGIYTCMAKSDVGHAKISITVKVKDWPEHGIQTTEFVAESTSDDKTSQQSLESSDPVTLVVNQKSTSADNTPPNPSGESGVGYLAAFGIVLVCVVFSISMLLLLVCKRGLDGSEEFLTNSKLSRHLQKVRAQVPTMLLQNPTLTGIFQTRDRQVQLP